MEKHSIKAADSSIERGVARNAALARRISS